VNNSRHNDEMYAIDSVDKVMVHLITNAAMMNS
jgi:hypothetical protein